MSQYRTKTEIISGQEVTLYSADGRSWSSRLQDIERWEKSKAEILRTFKSGEFGNTVKIGWPPVSCQD